MSVKDAHGEAAIDNPPILQILVLSDVHFGGAWVKDFLPPGSESKLCITNAVSMLESLIKVLEGRKIDCMFVAGDLTQTAKPQDFELCRNVLFKIAEELHLNSNTVYMTFGNHCRRSACYTVECLHRPSRNKDTEFTPL